MPEQFDVAIIGAGVLGTSVAYHLACAGLRVCVLEREPFVAVHASGKNAGMIRQLYHHSQLTEWTRQSIATWPEYLRPFFATTGSLVIGRELPAHNADLFQQLEVEHTNGKVSAIYTPSDGLLDSPGYVEAVKQLATRAGASFHFRTSVSKLSRNGVFWHLTLNDSSTRTSDIRQPTVASAASRQIDSSSSRGITAPWVVNASGAWLNQLFAPSSVSEDTFCSPSLSSALVHARPYARHLFVVSGWQDRRMPNRDCGFYWDEVLGWYMRSWDPHQRLVSICDKQAVTDVETFVPSNDTTDEALASRLLTALPSQSATLQVRQRWHCFRTYCDDQLPIWGEDPSFKGLFWLAAFGGFGMSTSFAAAADAAKWILGSTEKTIPEFCPSRVQTSVSQLLSIQNG